jgi:transcriptional regulator with XRE-family HTH domain
MPTGLDAKHEKLRKLLRKLRVEAGLRQVDVAARLRMPQSFVSKYESGERHLEFVEVAEICSALGIRLADLVRRFEAAG